MLSKQILGCILGAMLTMSSLPTHVLAANIGAKNSRHHDSSSSSSSSSSNSIPILSSDSSSSSSSKSHCSYKPNEYDYIIVGNGTAGAVLARRLSNNHKHRVLVLEAGPNLSHDPEVLDPIIFDNVTDLLYSPKYATNYTIPVPNGLLQNGIYTEARMWGGSSAHNYMIAVRATPSIYDGWAATSGNPRWTYNNLLSTMRHIETYTPDGTVANPAQRGSHGPIFITQQPPIDGINFAQAISTGTNSQFVTDYNDPTAYTSPPNVGTCVSAVQETKTPPPNSIRSFSINGYLPDSVITPEGKGRHGRNLRVISSATVSHILFKGNKAVGVECIVSGTTMKVKRAFAKKKVILCAGGIHSPALLQRSGIGDSTLLNSLDIPVLVNNPNVGANLENQYGPIVLLDLGATATPPTQYTQAFIDGSTNSGPSYYPNDGVRRIQPFFFPSTPDGAGGFSVLGAGFLIDSQNRGSIQIVNKDPLTYPHVDLNMFTDDVGTPGTDAYTAVSWLKILLNNIAPACTPPATVLFPTSADYTNDDTLLTYCQSNPNFVIEDHISGTCRMSTSALDGVVDGNLHVFGAENLMVVDLSVAPSQPDGNPSFPVYVIANEAAHILGVH